MKKYISKLFVLALAIATVGCSKDFLETAPTDSASAKDALSTPANMMVVLNGIHRNMYGQSDLGSYNYGGQSYLQPMFEFPASDALHSTEGNGWFKRNLQWTRHTNPNSGDLTWAWYHYYHVIMTSNNIINAADGMVVDGLLSNVLGQAYAYRAWAHFNLVRLWGKNYMHGNPSSDAGVPYMTKTSAPFEGQARESVGDVYTKIEADILKSLEYFDDATSRSDKSNLNIDVANGIAARIYLTMGNYTKASEHAALAYVNFPLMAADDVKGGFNSASNKEWMWAGTVVADQTNYYYSQFYYIGTNFNGSQNRGNPKFINHKLYAEISATDVRGELWDPLAPNTVDGFENDPNYDTEEEFDAARSEFLAKHDMTKSFNTYPFMSVKFKNSNGSTIEPDDVLYMRSAEMYLIEAEALARGGNNVGAAQSLFDLVSTRDADYVMSTKTGQDLIEEIKIHRRIELWGEGFRWFDMLRYDEELDRTGTGASSTLYQKGFQQGKPSTNSEWLYQIPLQEINANSFINLEDQN